MRNFERGGFAATSGALRLVEPHGRTAHRPPGASDAPIDPRETRESDAAGSMIAELLELVPVSRWTFGRIGPGGKLASCFGSHAGRDVELQLGGEYARRRTIVPGAPRIFPMATALAPYAFGAMLLFGDASTDRAVLTLERVAGLGAFTSLEDHLLALALDAISERLAAPRAHAAQPRVAATVDDDPTGATFAPYDGAFFVLDADLRIVMAWNAGDASASPAGETEPPAAERLPAIVERTVRALTAAWTSGARNEPGIAHPVPYLTVRTHPMSGPTGVFIAVHVDRIEPPGSLADAAARFHITPREVQVLALLLDGERLSQIGEHLSITASTVQDHIRSMVEKTGSRNRSELIARVLGWPSLPEN